MLTDAIPHFKFIVGKIYLFLLIVKQYIHCYSKFVSYI